MRKEEKQEIVTSLVSLMKDYGSFYIADTSELTVGKINAIRRKCFESEIKMQVVKNTLIKKAVDSLDGDFSSLEPALKGASTIMFSRKGNAPARLIKDLRREGDKPVLKAAYIDASFFIGDSQLDTLVNLKSKEELVADIIALLQSPAKNVVSSLQSGKHKLAGIVKTLQNRG